MTRNRRHRGNVAAAEPGGRKNTSNPQVGTKLPTRHKTADFPDPAPDPLVFTREDWTELRDPDRISAKAGVPLGELPRVVLKELVDNALDASGSVKFGILPLPDGAFGFYVSDDGAGIPGADDQLAVHFSMRRPLTSSKTRRMPTRGMLGNGLRVVVGVVYIADGELRVYTRGRVVVLKPRSDGTSEVLRSEPWEGTDTRIDVVLRGDLADYAAADDELFDYARVAQEMNAGETYKGKPSPWWYGDGAFWELLQASGARPVERAVEDLDGCTDRAKVAAVLGALKGRPCNEVTAEEAALVLAAARHKARPVTQARLGKVGRRDDYAGYGIATGEFRRSGAIVPFVVEVWANRSAAPGLTLCINRTPVVASPSVWRDSGGAGCYVLDGCGFTCNGFEVGAKRGGEFALLVNVISPFVPLTSSGKDPDVGPMADAIAKALKQAVQRAKRATPRNSPRTSQKDIIVGSLADAVAHLSGGGEFLFSLRQLFYHIRPHLIRGIGKEPLYGTFSRIVGEYEDEHGDIENLYRDDRGTLYHPHTGESIRLGTRSMATYERPKWAFNKILYCEKEGLFPILQHARWPERHDCALLTSKGYATRAARQALKLISGTGEPAKLFCVHDADGDGTLIHEVLASGLAGASADVINLGVEPAEARAMGLEVEPVNRKKRVRVAQYVPKTDREWLQKNRIELNAMSTPQFVEWLTAKIAPHDTGKVVPPTDVVKGRLAQETRRAVTARLTEEAIRAANIPARVEAELRRLASDLADAAREVVTALPASLAARPDTHWSAVVADRAARLASGEHSGGAE